MHCKICKTSLQDQVSHPRRAPDSYPALDAGLRGQESHTYWGDPEKQNLGWHLTWYDVPVSFPWKRTLFSRFLDRGSAIHQKKKPKTASPWAAAAALNPALLLKNPPCRHRDVPGAQQTGLCALPHWELPKSPHSHCPGLGPLSSHTRGARLLNSLWAALILVWNSAWNAEILVD